MSAILTIYNYPLLILRKYIKYMSKRRIYNKITFLIIRNGDIMYSKKLVGPNAPPFFGEFDERVVLLFLEGKRRVVRAVG